MQSNIIVYNTHFHWNALKITKNAVLIICATIIFPLSLSFSIAYSMAYAAAAKSQHKSCSTVGFMDDHQRYITQVYPAEKQVSCYSFSKCMKVKKVNLSVTVGLFWATWTRPVKPSSYGILEQEMLEWGANASLSTTLTLIRLINPSLGKTLCCQYDDCTKLISGPGLKSFWIFICPSLSFFNILIDTSVRTYLHNAVSTP